MKEYQTLRSQALFTCTFDQPWFPPRCASLSISLALCNLLQFSHTSGDPFNRRRKRAQGNSETLHLNSGNVVVQNGTRHP